jgi:hypothetical protein
LWLGALALVGGALDFLLALFYTVDGQSGAPISGADMTTGVPLIGVVIYTGLLIIAWAAWHDPDVEKRRAVRRTVRARRAAEIGPEHPLRASSACCTVAAEFLVVTKARSSGTPHRGSLAGPGLTGHGLGSEQRTYMPSHGTR